MKTPKITLADVRKRFEKEGFAVSGGTGDTLEVRKYGCLHRIGSPSGGFWAPLEPPSFVVQGHACRLEDQGYQKFWLGDGKRFPIKLEDLHAIQKFDQEVRFALDLKSLYNESLGSTCARSAYDRVDGRPDA